ncbi:MAG TPA: 3-hydroxyacyl-CoA dehydrogenase family protein [Cyclobacteriaceae bacterium]|nr:3-hydroxyacyl-CoA dehydrogenase family protein [Cyclobacteriaceae bacterium]
MDILIVGTDENARECQEKFGQGHAYQMIEPIDAGKYPKEGSVVFDFSAKEVAVYKQEGHIVFLNSSKTTLKKLTSGKPIGSTVFGFCGLPTFLNREILEVTTLSERPAKILEKVCGELNTEYKIVEDKVGMITPRIIGMIINEAYFAIEGEVASRKDIDLAMKLGTNYPFGPFEWSEKIGVKNVYELLRAVRDETGDDRYQICSSLEKEALH